MPVTVTEGIEDHPSVLAWMRLDANQSMPRAVEVLRAPRTGKASVVRLVGVGEKGGSVIAKNSMVARTRTEARVYEITGRRLAREQLRYYGSVESPDQTGWLFTEDVAGEPFSFSNEVHAALALEWLADLHTSVPDGDLLPDRGTGYYFSRLSSGMAGIIERWDNPDLTPVDRELLEALVRSGERILRSRREIEALCESLPRALTHGDFKPKNLRVRNDGRRSILFVFDWEDAGWGFPGVDIWKLNSKAYWEKVRGHWGNLTLEEAGQLSAMGKLFRCFNAIDWLAPSLGYRWLEQPMARFRVYLDRITAVIHETPRLQ